MNMDFLKVEPYWPDLPRVKACTLVSREAAAHVNFKGDSDTAKQCRAAAQAMENFVNEIHWIGQPHQNNVSELPLEENYEVDGVLTRESYIACAMRAADCLPLFVADKNESVVGVAHCGWKGLKLGIVQKIINRMRVPRENIMCWLAPAISAPFYEVGIDLVDQFSDATKYTRNVFRERGNGKFDMDLYRLAHNILIDEGVLSSNIGGGQFCTFSDTRMHSVRRDGAQAGRMASLIWLTDSGA